MLSKDQIDFYNEYGYIRIPKVFTSEETDELASTLDWLIDDWAQEDRGWTGPFRDVYLDEETNEKSMLVAMHDLHFYSDAWNGAVNHPRLTEAISDLIGPNVELHHSTMHVKPAETGHLFPMHQDWAFYQHEDGRYVDVLVHLDDTDADNGEIRFLDGSHKNGALEHVLTNPDGSWCAPHLPTDQYRLEDSVPVPAERGDVVCFNFFTVHGSYLNKTDTMRRLVRIGYRDPDNVQTGGQSIGRPGRLVRGRRPRNNGDDLFSTAGPVSASEPATH